ncbi:MAG: tRNA threonylcarbamoyladenosine dehydratase [Clostridia bacterium]|nr:tRNA threonylcarbamoyladenosine dehydratase [Clostridia bacterium]
MDKRFSRTAQLLGDEALQKLKNSRVAVFGLGGVGGYAAEALARTGVGAIDLIDSDTVDITNLNRQIIATQSTVGMDKTEAMKKRIADINPEIRVTAHKLFYSAETAEKLSLSQYDYIVDAIDTVTSKIELIINAQKSGTPIISSMGTGNKLNAYELEVSDIYKTSVCPLARVMRYELKKRGVKGLKVVYSREEPRKSSLKGMGGKSIPASCAFVPGTAGLIIAGEVTKDILNL